MLEDAENTTQAQLRRGGCMIRDETEIAIRDEAEIARSTIEARKTVLSPAQGWSCVDPPTNTVFPLEYAFRLLGDIQDKHVLDLGCGTGGEIPTLAWRGARVTGIDPFADLIALARERMRRLHIEADLRVGSAYQTELPDGSVDVIFCMSVIHHLDIPMAVGEMRRILKPDGFIVMKEPICFSRMYAKMRTIFPASDETSEYEHPLTREDFTKVQEGFRVSGLRLFRLPFVAIAERYLSLKPRLFMKSSDFLLRHCHYLEDFATVAVMKLSRWFYARPPHLLSLVGFKD